MALKAALLSLTLLLSSCYQMPTDDDFCLIPATNNPTVTNAKGGNMLPSTSY